MSSVEDRGVSKIEVTGEWGEEEEAKLQENVDIVIDFMAVASIMWSYGSPDVALEVATCARLAMDEIVGMCRHHGNVSAEGKSWDFVKLLGSLGGETLGEVIYWAAKSRCSAVPADAKALLKDFANFVRLNVESDYVGESILEYLSRSINKTLAALAVSARRIH